MLLDFLNDYYQAELKNIHDVAGNQHLVGYSRLYDCDLFVKIFEDEAMFYAEQHVNQVYCPEIYLDSVLYEDYYVVALRDRKMQEVIAEEKNLLPKQAQKYGRMLADFHNQLTGQAKVINDERPLSQRLAEKIAILKGTEHEDVVVQAYQILQADLVAADQEYQQLPKVVVHGDFSLRNIMFYDKHEILIDFEKAHMGVAYEDMLKFFYNEVHAVTLRKEFLKGYRRERRFEIPQIQLQRVMLFFVALDILEYHVTHPKKKFGNMATRMLQTIVAGDALLAI